MKKREKTETEKVLWRIKEELDKKIKADKELMKLGGWLLMGRVDGFKEAIKIVRKEIQENRRNKEWME